MIRKESDHLPELRDVRIEVKRTYKEKQTIGDLSVKGSMDEFHNFKSIELKWNNNIKEESCIPEGVYLARKRPASESKAFDYDHIEITNVPNRNYILIHAANFSRQLLGCIAPGMRHLDIDNDGLMDVAESRKALMKIMGLLPEEFYIRIYS